MRIGQKVFVIKVTKSAYAAKKAIITKKIPVVSLKTRWLHSIACYNFCLFKYEVLYNNNTRETVSSNRLEYY
jgi:hypothetical protein